MSAVRTGHVPPPTLPFFFGPPERPLFGCYTAAAPGRQTGVGIVVCPPVGQDYFRAHRALRLLATRLGGLGFAVLRFDYHGCGDSAGSAEENRLGEWIDDVATAVGEVKRRGAARVGLVGLRLGAAPALLAAAERCEADGLVLWDPVFDGRSYLAELEDQQRAMQHVRGIPHGRAPAGAVAIDVLGFPLSEALRLDLERLDLAAVARRAAEKVLVIESGPEAKADRLAAQLTAQGAVVHSRHLPGPAFWLQELEGALVPQQVLQATTVWAAESFA